MTDELILLMEFDTFQSWLVRGVERFAFSAGTRLADFPRDAQADEKTGFLVSLPKKYSRFARHQQQVYLLVDEIKAASLASEEQTREWASRLHNLGETWLPFKYRPDWLNAIVIPAYLVSDQQQAYTSTTDIEPSLVAEDPSQAQEIIETRRRPSKRTRSKKPKVQEDDVRRSRPEKPIKRVEPVKEDQLPLFKDGEAERLPKQSDEQEVVDG